MWGIFGAVDNIRCRNATLVVRQGPRLVPDPQPMSPGPRGNGVAMSCVYHSVAMLLASTGLPLTMPFALSSGTDVVFEL